MLAYKLFEFNKHCSYTVQSVVAKNILIHFSYAASCLGQHMRAN